MVHIHKLYSQFPLRGNITKANCFVNSRISRIAYLIRESPAKSGGIQSRDPRTGRDRIYVPSQFWLSATFGVKFVGRRTNI